MCLAVKGKASFTEEETYQLNLEHSLGAVAGQQVELESHIQGQQRETSSGHSNFHGEGVLMVMRPSHDNRRNWQIAADGEEIPPRAP